MPYYLETYASGKGWERGDALSGLTELLANSRPAMRIIDEVGNVVARNNAASVVEGAVSALAAKSAARKKKPPTAKLRAEMHVIIRATSFLVILTDAFKKNRTVAVPMPSGDWREGFRAGRKIVAEHGRGSLYAVTSARELHVDDDFTIEAIERFTALNPEEKHG